MHVESHLAECRDGFFRTLPELVLEAEEHRRPCAAAEGEFEKALVFRRLLGPAPGAAAETDLLTLEGARQAEAGMFGDVAHGERCQAAPRHFAHESAGERVLARLRQTRSQRQRVGRDMRGETSEGSPRVRVPVLSKITVSTPESFSRAAPSLIMMPARNRRPEATT